MQTFLVIVVAAGVVGGLLLGLLAAVVRRSFPQAFVVGAVLGVAVVLLTFVALEYLLSRAQMDVLAAFVAAGGSVRDAAELVSIRPSTVKRHSSPTCGRGRVSRPSS
jgi:NhaP-type Na+/H+ or K+/H+ antiporter